jgi:hypothetical protein
MTHIKPFMVPMPEIPEEGLGDFVANFIAQDNDDLYFALTGKIRV